MHRGYLHGGGLKDRPGCSPRQLLVEGVTRRDEQRVAAKHEVYARVRHQSRLQLSDITISAPQKRRDANTRWLLYQNDIVQKNGTHLQYLSVNH